MSDSVSVSVLRARMTHRVEVGDVLRVRGGSFELVRAHGSVGAYLLVERGHSGTRRVGRLAGVVMDVVFRPPEPGATAFTKTPEGIEVFVDSDLDLNALDSADAIG